MEILMELCKKRINAFYKMRNELDYLIEVYKIRSTSDMTEENKSEISGLLLEAIDDTAEWFTECDNLENIKNYLSRYMQSNLEEDRDLFLLEIKEGIFRHYKPHFDEYIYQHALRINYFGEDDAIDDAIETRIYNSKINIALNLI